MLELSTLNDYEGKQVFWERGSSIRTRPRRMLSIDDDCPYFFPLSRQPLCIHPIVVSMGESAREFILTQSLYRFMMEIAVLETEVVNSGALLIANSKLNIPFPDALKHDALSVIIDEAYHAYVAIDFMKQVQDKTDIVPLNLPKETAALFSIHTIKKMLPEDLQSIFELIAVSIGEHVLTMDLITIGKENMVSKTFTQVMADHVLDEGRHANIFKQVLTILWMNLNENAQNILGPLLPTYMKLYLQTNLKIQKDYDLKILTALNLSVAQIEQIMTETYVEYDQEPIVKTNPVINNLIKLLERCGILYHLATKQAFINDNFI